MLPDKVLNEIKRQVKVAAEHGIDISDIPEELQPQEKQEISKTQNLGETPSGEGGR